jgi:uncharacterized membrane protein (UPF0127 family)
MPGPRIAPRLDRLPRRAVLGREVPVAAGFRARLLGLAFLGREWAGAGLLIPRCSSVHTFGMCFALDIVFLDERGAPLAIRRNVRPRRFARHRRAAAVLEIPAGQGGEFAGASPLGA